jgi:hypothetical protein
MDSLRDGTYYTIGNKEFSLEDGISDSDTEFIVNEFIKCLQTFKNNYNVRLVYYPSYPYYFIAMNKASMCEIDNLADELEIHLEKYKLNLS